MIAPNASVSNAAGPTPSPECTMLSTDRKAGSRVACTGGFLVDPRHRGV